MDYSKASIPRPVFNELKDAVESGRLVGFRSTSDAATFAIRKLLETSAAKAEA